MSTEAATVPLSWLDQAFVLLERRRQPFHVAYLALLAPPAGVASAAAVTQLIADLRAGGSPRAPFDRCLGLSGGRLAWKPAPDFALDRHLLRLSLPAAGRMDDLLALVGRLHALPLERDAPPWRIYLIEGLGDGRIAVYAKLHHALADGVAGTRLLLQSFSADPTAHPEPPWAVPTTPPRMPRPIVDRSGGWLTRLAAAGVVLGELQRTARDVRRRRAEVVGGRDAPACLINRRVGPARSVGVCSLSLARVRVIAQVLGGTTNDVVLALCAAALRRFLVERDALPDASLVAMVPMSTRDEGDEALGNRIVPLLVRLGTDIDDPLDRFALIRRSAGHSKERFAGLSIGESYAYALASSSLGLLQLLLRPEGGRLPFNIVISNLRGPATPQYWHGLRLDGLHPMSVVLDGQAMNLTFASREDRLDFGLTACRQAVPGAARVLEYLGHSLDELEACLPAHELSRPRTTEVPAESPAHRVREAKSR
jgi:diacylglycerol O-acyltransferase